MIRHLLIVLAIIGGLSGCATATVGANFSAEGLIALQPGASTIDDARRLLGEPQQYTATAGMGQLLTWQYVRSSATGTSVKTESRAAHLLFDNQGVLIRVQSLQNVPLPADELTRLQGASS